MFILLDWFFFLHSQVLVFNILDWCFFAFWIPIVIILDCGFSFEWELAIGYFMNMWLSLVFAYGKKASAIDLITWLA
jgi:hypothetical protein